MRRDFRSWICFLAVAVLLLLAKLGRAATLTVNPSSTPHEDANPVTLTITGLAFQETAIVEQFHDANANGQADSGETLLLHLKVTDGRVEMFGGVRNDAIPGDEDGATNGQITVLLRLNALPEASRLVGSYVWKLSSPTASFSPVTAPFNLLQAAHSQAVRGIVTANGSPVAHAMVAALSAAGQGEDFAGGVFTDASGQFILNLPAGDYMLAGLKTGFIMPLSTAPAVSLASGMTVTQDIAIATAERTISGRVFDAVTSNGVAGVQIFAESMASEVAITHTDAAGNFSIGAGIGQWRLNPSEHGLRLLGYSGEDYPADTTSGDVSGVEMPLTKGRGNFELVFFFPGGSFGNGTNGNIGFPTQLDYYYALFNLQDVNFPTNVFFSGPAGSGLQNTPSATYGANFQGDSAFYSSPQIYLGPFPPGGVYEVNYKNEPLQFVLPDPQAQSRQVVLVPTVTLDSQEQVQQIAWTPRDTSGNPIGAPSFIESIQIRVDGMGGRIYQADVLPDATSHVFQSAVAWTNVSSIQMVYDDVAGNQYVCFWHRGFQPMQILTGTNLPPATAGTFYQTLFVAAGGQPPFLWSLQTGNLPEGLNFGGTGELSGTPSTAGAYNLRVRATDANMQWLEQDFVLVVQPGSQTVSVQPIVHSPGRFELRVVGLQVGQACTVQYSQNLVDWFPLLNTNAPSASFDVVDPAANDSARFYRVSRP